MAKDESWGSSLLGCGILSLLAAMIWQQYWHTLFVFGVCCLAIGKVVKDYEDGKRKNH